MPERISPTPKIIGQLAYYLPFRDALRNCCQTFNTKLNLFNLITLYQYGCTEVHSTTHVLLLLSIVESCQKAFPRLRSVGSIKIIPKLEQIEKLDTEMMTAKDTDRDFDIFLEVRMSI